MKRTFRFVCLTCVALLLLLVLPVSAASPTPDYIGTEGNLNDIFEGQSFQTASGYQLNYQIYKPYDFDPEASYPLVLFLHGAGERGSDNCLQLTAGINVPFRQENSPLYRCIVVAPQCPAEKQWVNVEKWQDSPYSVDEIAESEELAAVAELVTDLCGNAFVDSDRVYVTGLSMGGYGTWDLLVRHGDLFAAAIPLCGGCDVSRAESLVEIPIRTYHGTGDTTVPSAGTAAMVEAIRAAGGEKIEYFPMFRGHNIWDEVYATEGLFEWLLEQRLSDRIEPTGTTESPTTEPAPVSTEQKTAKSGCASVMAPAGAGALLTVLAGMALAKQKKKH